MVLGPLPLSRAALPARVIGWIVVALLALAPAAAPAGTPAWRPIGPADGETRALVVDPADARVLWAIGSDGFYRSGDSGATWVQMWAQTDNLPDLGTAIEIDPANPATLYLQAGDRGLLKSTNGGADWALIDPGVEPWLLASYPRTVPFTLLVVGQGQALVRSHNGGQTWDTVTTVVDPSHPRDQVELVAVLPDATGVIYAVTSRGFHRTTDGGATWTMTAPVSYDALAVHPDEPDVVYATTQLDGHRLSRSDDGGQTWHSIASGVPHSVVGALVLDPITPARVWVATSNGLYRSGNRGDTWLQIGPFADDDWLWALAIDPAHPQTVVVGGLVEPPGPNRSTNDGTSWVAGHAGLPPGHCGSMASDPFDPEVIYAGSAGVYRSRDRGASWELVTREAQGSVALDPLAEGVIYAAAWPQDGLAPGVAKSTNGGTSWVVTRVVGVGLSIGVWTLEVDPTRVGTVYAGAGPRLNRSDDGGTTWMRLDAGPYLPSPIRIVTHPGRAGVLLVPGDGVYSSTDFGDTWAVSREGLMRDDSCFGPTPCRVHDLALDPFRVGVIYAATECGLFRSADTGLTWQLAADGLPQVTCAAPPGGCTVCDGPVGVAASKARPGLLYAVARDGLYSSLDGGASWHSVISAGLGDPARLSQDPGLHLVLVESGHGLLLNPGNEGLLALWLDEPRAPRGRLP